MNLSAQTLIVYKEIRVGFARRLRFQYGNGDGGRRRRNRRRHYHLIVVYPVKDNIDGLFKGTGIGEIGRRVADQQIALQTDSACSITRGTL